MNKKKWIKLGLTVLLAFSYSLRHKGQRECNQSTVVTVTAEAENAQEALSMYKKLMDQRTRFFRRIPICGKSYMEADKGSAILEKQKNYGDFLLDTIENVESVFGQNMTAQNLY
ncbi:MAG: hypothetical protein ACLURV_08680 [Gallintestinimicrobium sp.]